MTAIIVEDELIIAEHLKSILINNSIDVLQCRTNFEDAIKDIKLKPDFYILDINLNDTTNGIFIAEHLRKSQIPFIFITANNDLNTLKNAIKTKPTSYITKPFKNRDIVAALELIKLNISHQSFLVINGANKTITLKQDEILYCKANGSYTDVYTKNLKYTQRINLKDLLLQLDTNFLRVHRSYIINKTKIKHQNSTSITIENVIVPKTKSYVN